MRKKNTSPKTLTEILRDRLNAHPSLLRLAAETGVQRLSLSRFRRGLQSLHLDAADKLVAHFGIEVRDPENEED